MANPGPASRSPSRSPETPVPDLGPEAVRWPRPSWDFCVVGTRALGRQRRGTPAPSEYLLDLWLGTTPWLTFAGLVFGITCAVLLAYANFRKFV